MNDIAVLCARRDSIYKSIEACDVYDIDRDARTFAGDRPVIAHPPCRSFGRLRTFAKPRLGERELAVWCADMVRQCGGVLEHPGSSTLWPAAGLPAPGFVDSYDGWTLAIDQLWFGHKAIKRTWLYIVGLSPSEIPSLQFSLNYPSHSVCSYSGTPKHLRLPELSKADRERTPPDLAGWLVEACLRVLARDYGVAA